ncbi:MAG: hypothetical protein A3H70_04675 [Candidatus Komeilibacteria bacterium RIFCSPLOWO2_02_FULL_48_11]|uniref:DUF2304 domain-containing protein n=1 Tax=Candidatus Komeilibacteria bacterium RIFCSPLOWO2_02_FULL_48_11 TaxID=1798553 RepID=A0A1G2BU07_9BACT|nr:MAG: hypothetical protein A3H70_04675 [Candidatus Komeilibacteria bacterium RIFCSPLOWO2_02_FULL_48_11]
MIIQIITIIIVLFLLTRIGAKLKRKQISLQEALLWGLIWFGVGVVVLYPKLTDRLAAAIGLQSAKGIDLVVYLAVGLVFYLVFRLFVRLEKMEQDITKIVRHVALKDKEEQKD